MTLARYEPLSWSGPDWPLKLKPGQLLISFNSYCSLSNNTKKKKKKKTRDISEPTARLKNFLHSCLSDQWHISRTRTKKPVTAVKEEAMNCSSHQHSAVRFNGLVTFTSDVQSLCGQRRQPRSTRLPSSPLLTPPHPSSPHGRPGENPPLCFYIQQRFTSTRSLDFTRYVE